MLTPESSAETGQTIGEYLIARLHALGVGHVFGIPGDYVLGFYDQLVASELKVVTTCDEQGAGFAADAYARIRGLGVVCVTYCVGGLKVANSTAGAFAEKSPVVVISGAPRSRRTPARRSGFERAWPSSWLNRDRPDGRRRPQPATFGRRVCQSVACW